MTTQSSQRSQKPEQAYHLLPAKVKNTVSLVIHLTILVLSLLITDLGAVFDFAGTIGSSFVSFFFPAICFLILIERNGSERMKQRWSTTMYKVIAWVFLLVGTAAVVSYFTVVGLKISGKFDGASKAH